MNNEPTGGRRKFLKQSLRGTAVAALSGAAAISLMESCAGNKGAMAGGAAGSTKLSTRFDQTPLPYAYSALEDAIDAKTMELHYSKHAAAYSKALKEAVAAEAVDPSADLEAVLGNISKYSAKLRNNGGGHYNHEMFWKSMRAPQKNNVPVGVLATAITVAFGSFENFKAQFTDAGKNRFGSGWAWLYRTGKGELKIGSTPNQDNPLMNVSNVKGFPVLGLDVWEHAYYLKYQNRRPEYIERWWDVVNWDYIHIRFTTG